LLADDLESLIEDFSGVPIRAGLDGQVEHTLLFGFQVNRHGRFLAALTMLNCSHLLAVVKHEKYGKTRSKKLFRRLIRALQVMESAGLLEFLSHDLSQR
jgi:hypothetical protein